MLDPHVCHEAAQIVNCYRLCRKVIMANVSR